MPLYVCACAFQHINEGKLLNFILHENMHNCCHVFTWWLGFGDPLLGLGTSQNSLGCVLINKQI